MFASVVCRGKTADPVATQEPIRGDRPVQSDWARVETVDAARSAIVARPVDETNLQPARASNGPRGEAGESRRPLCLHQPKERSAGILPKKQTTSLCRVTPERSIIDLARQFLRGETILAKQPLLAYQRKLNSVGNPFCEVCCAKARSQHVRGWAGPESLSEQAFSILRRSCEKPPHERLTISGRRSPPRSTSSSPTSARTTSGPQDMNPV